MPTTRTSDNPTLIHWVTAFVALFILNIVIPALAAATDLIR